MDPKVSKIFRSVQVYFPYLQDYRFLLQRTMRSLFNRTHESDFDYLPYLQRSSNNLFVDIGSNRGDAIQSILMRRPDAKVIAFEPNQFLTQKVEKLYGKDSRVEIHNVGLGSESGTFDLYVPFYNNYMFDGLASFKEENARDWLKNRIYGYKESKLAVRQIKCEVRRLDDYKLRPYFIKIDVQGFEYEVLLGAKQTLLESKPILLIETPGPEEMQFLKEIRYSPFIYRNHALVPGKNGLNVFFLPELTYPKRDSAEARLLLYLS